MTASRKDARSFLPLTPAVLHILLSLTDGPRHGYAIAKESSERTSGEIKLGPGTLYGTLGRLATAGLVSETDGGADADERRRFYRITPLGREVIGLEARRLAGVVSVAKAKALI
jgi:DNA-binding PadR family transcriptional regulator